MTINEKANKVGLPVDKVVELAFHAGLDSEDMDRKLDNVEAITLGKVVNQYLKARSEPKDEHTLVRFWTKATKHMIQAGNERIEFKDNVLVLDKKDDIGLISMIRGLRNIVGRYSIYEVIDEPHADESDESVAFSDMLEDIAFTGHNRERSKAGIKSIRAMFSPEELESMGEHGFDPRRLVMKALRTKSLKLVSNN